VRTREHYVHPPLVGAEPPSPAMARWRYRVVAGVLLLVALAVLVWVFLRFSGVTGGEDPGLIGTLPAPVSAAAGPAAAGP
jgi:hypothetical protein